MSVKNDSDKKRNKSEKRISPDGTMIREGHFTDDQLNGWGKKIVSTHMILETLPVVESKKEVREEGEFERDYLIKGKKTFYNRLKKIEGTGEIEEYKETEEGTFSYNFGSVMYLLKGKRILFKMNHIDQVEKEEEGEFKQGRLIQENKSYSQSS